MASYLYHVQDQQTSCQRFAGMTCLAAKPSSTSNPERDESTDSIPPFGQDSSPTHGQENGNYYNGKSNGTRGYIISGITRSIRKKAKNKALESFPLAHWLPNFANLRMVTCKTRWWGALALEGDGLGPELPEP